MQNENDSTIRVSTEGDSQVDQDDVRNTQPARKQYSKPRIEDYGSLAHLAAGGSFAGGDSNGSY